MVVKTQKRLKTLGDQNIYFNINGKVMNRVRTGIDKLATAVGVTLGPKGRNVVLCNDVESPYIVNDGVTVARNVVIADPVENLGVAILQQAACKTNEQVGDGTSTATILGAALIYESIKITSTGVNPTEVVKGIEIAVQNVICELKNMSTEIRSELDILNIASNSAGNNKQIGNIILNALTEVGREGVVHIQDSITTEDELTIIEGMQLDRGYYSPYFVTDVEKMVAEYENCRVLIVDKNITGAREIIGQLEASMKANYPLLILAESIDQEALATIIVNRLRNSLKVIAVKAPGFGDRKTQYLEDIAILTGGTVIKADLGMRLENSDCSVLGSASKVTSNKSTCTIVGDGSQLNAVNARVQQIRKLLELTDVEFDKNTLNERLARLTCGIGIISIGAQTDTEFKEKKLRVEDALCATRAALAEGFVAGGGSTLFKISNKLEDIMPNMENEEQKLGVNIVKKAIAYPLRLIAANAGVNGAVVELKICDSTQETHLGFNAATNTFEDLVAAGIIDPTKVIRCALENASSVARTFMLSGAIVTKIPKQNNTRSTASMSNHEEMF